MQRHVDREPRLADEHDAAGKQAERPEEPEADGEPAEEAVAGRVDPDGNAGGDENADRRVQDPHRDLQQANPERQVGELVDDQRPLLGPVLVGQVGVGREGLGQFGQHADAVDDSAEAVRRGEDERTRRGDEHGRGDHRTEHTRGGQRVEDRHGEYSIPAPGRD